MPTNKFTTAHKRLVKLRNKAIANLQQKHASTLSYLQEKQLLLPQIREHSVKLLTSAALAGAVLLSPGKSNTNPLLAKPAEQRIKLGLATAEEVKKLLAEKVSGLLPGAIGKLPQDTQEKIYQVLKDTLGVEAVANLQGKELNYSYGWIGYEQHLKRYPGDDLIQHDDEQVAGIAPGLGAWGYFVPSREAMSQEVYLMEKYYVAVQTLYLPEWYTNTKELSEWYKHRKVIVVNPENGTACVGVVADAGPAEWTGKQFGGSPELMKALNLHLKSRKGKVVLLFVDDPNNQVPMGPINFNIQAGKPEVI
jgi:hypothetical protein